MARWYGLTIAITNASDEGAACDDAHADIQWQRHCTEKLEDHDVSSVSEIEHHGETWTRHVFAHRATTFCEFAVSPCGHRVMSRALPTVLDSDTVDLFAEPVMRTIFRRLGVVSFHGAALEKNRKCILILGAKRAGKSTLAAALVQHGWSLLTDDLARVVYAGGRWCIAPGFRQLKLSDETLEHFGYAPNMFERRWSSPAATEAPELNKRVVRWVSSADDGEIPLDAIYLLGQRLPGLTGLRIAPLSAIDQFRGLLANATQDAIAPAAPPRREVAEVVGALLRQAPLRSLVMPASLSRSVEAAAGL